MNPNPIYIVKNILSSCLTPRGLYLQNMTNYKSYALLTVPIFLKNQFEKMLLANIMCR